jgi:regulator of protease activity HflC (stomatin/prohibitin superfamily)
MSDSSVSILGYAVIAMLVFFYIRSIVRGNQQQQAELVAAKRAKQKAEAEAEKERQVAEKERLRAAQLAVLAQAQQKAKDDADTSRFWTDVGSIGFSFLSIFLNSEDGE